MEDVPEIYLLPYDPDYPVVGRDESCRQLIGEVRDPIPCQPGQPVCVDEEYVRNEMSYFFWEVEPPTGRRHVEITQYRTRKNWPSRIKQMLDERYPHAINVRLVIDDLNTHNIASLYKTFDSEEACLAARLEVHYTPKHGSWLNMTEIELSVLKGQCLNYRIADMATMQAEVAAWKNARNNGTNIIKAIIGPCRCPYD